MKIGCAASERKNAKAKAKTRAHANAKAIAKAKAQANAKARARAKNKNNILGANNKIEINYSILLKSSTEKTPREPRHFRIIYW